MGKTAENLTCILKRFLGKLTSARFLTTILVIGTLCWSVDKCLDIAVTSAANKEVFILVKDIIMLLLGAFVSSATAIVTLYFSRTDRDASVADNGSDTDASNGNDPLKK
jgi:hypothetical protein